MHNPAALEHLRPVETALDGIPALALNGPEAKTLRNGQGVPVFRSMDRDRFGHLREGDLVYAREGEVPVAIARIEGGAIRPVRALNLCTQERGRCRSPPSASPRYTRNSPPQKANTPPPR